MLKSTSAFTQNRNPHGDGRYIPILDGWRAIAILLVLLFHGLLNSDTSGHPALLSLSKTAGHIGTLGVLVFFSISGYLITQRLLVESRSNGTFSLRAFYIKRVFRILPPLAAYLLVMLGLYAIGAIALRKGDWASIFFLSNYFKGSWYTTHFWSLSVEEHFYLIWPIYASLLGWRKAMWGGVALVLAVAVWRPYELHYIGLHNIGTKAKYLQHTDLRIDYIMMGALVALAVEFYPDFATFLKRLGSGAGLSVLFFLLLVSIKPSSIDLRSVQAALLTLIVCGSALANAPVPRLLLANRPILFLGKVSYSLYVWQQFFLSKTDNAFWNRPSALPIKYVAALVTAYLSYQFLEKPFIRYGRAFIKLRSQSAMEVGIEPVA